MIMWLLRQQNKLTIVSIPKTLKSKAVPPGAAFLNYMG